MAISIINVAKNSLKFTTVGAISALLGVPVSIYVATILVPEEYGVFGFLGLWLMYATIISPGVLVAGLREVPVLLGRGKEEEALRIQNISISSEMLYLVIPFVIILGASFFYSDTVLKLGLVIIAASYIMKSLARLWSGTNRIREKFNIVAKGDLISAILAPIVILASVNWLGVYALLIGPLIAGTVLWIYYLKKGPINYRFKLERSEIIRLIKVGIVLQTGTLVYWIFRLTDRTIIASMLPLEQLGLYAFAMTFIMYAAKPLADFVGVLQPVLWREAGKADDNSEGFKDAKRLAIYITLGTAVIIPIIQLGSCLVINLVTTNYIDSLPVLYVLSYILYFWALGAIPSLILTSVTVNKQNILLCIYAIGLALNIVFDLLAIKLGYGIVGVAWVTIGTQGLATLIAYYFVRDYISRSTKEFVKFQILTLVPLAICMIFYFLHSFLYSVIPSIWTFTIMSLASQLIIWSVVIGIFYRGYFSISDLRRITREISTVILQIKDRLSPKEE